MFFGTGRVVQLSGMGAGLDRRAFLATLAGGLLTAPLASTDPRRAGAAGLAHPGGNLTGLRVGQSVLGQRSC